MIFEKNKLLFLVILVLLFSSVNFVSAKEFSIVSSISGEELNGFVRIDSLGDYYVAEGEKLVLPDLSGLNTTYDLLLKSQHLDTFDYKSTLTHNSDSELVARPIGLLRLSVKDELDNLIIGADVSVNCPTEVYLLKTNSVGMLRAFLPTENCSISVFSKNRVSSFNANIQQGLITEKTVVLKSIPQNNYLLYSLIILFVIIIAFYLAFRKKEDVLNKKEEVIDKEEKKIDELEEDLKQEEFLAEKMREALKEKELLIIDSLIARSGKASLSEIRSATHIPRTSLLRTIDSLEQRNLLIKKSENKKVWVELAKNN